MKWFKHITTSANDEKLALLIDEFGYEAYGFWWRLMEIIAESVDEKSITSLTFSRKKWCSLFILTNKKFTKLFLSLRNAGLIFVKIDGDRITIDIPNILKYRDEWTIKKANKANETPESTPESTLKSLQYDKKKNKKREEQKKETKEKVLAPTGAVTGKPSRECLEFEFYIWIFNRLFKTKHRPTEGVKRKFSVRRKQCDLDVILVSLSSMASQKFYQGENDRGWIASPEFHLRNEENVMKFLADSDTDEFGQEIKAKLPDLKKKFMKEREAKNA